MIIYAVFTNNEGQNIINSLKITYPNAKCSDKKLVKMALREFVENKRMQRMIDKNKLQFDYDKKADVLYATIGPSRAGRTDEKGNGIAITYNIKNNEPIGFIIVDYMKRMKRKMIKKIPEFGIIKLPIYNLE